MTYKYLLPYARLSLEHGLIHNAASFLNPTLIPDVHKPLGVTFVSLTIDNINIGCIGNTDTPAPLYKSVMDNAFRSGFKDSRFPAINLYRLNKCSIKISVLKDRTSFTYSTIKYVESAIGTNHSLVIRYGLSTVIMLSYMKFTYANMTEFINATLSKGGLTHIPFKLLTITLIDTEETDSIPFKDIPCHYPIDL